MRAKRPLAYWAIPPDNLRCKADVSKATTMPRWGRCKKRNGYGEDGLYCKQHAKRYPEGKI